MHLLIQTVLPAAMFAIGGVPPVALTATPISPQVDDVSPVDPGTPPDPISERLLYVSVQGDASIAIVDMDALEMRTLIRLTDLGFAAQSAPHDVAVAANGRNWYVSLVGDHRVLQFDEENRLVSTFEMETPGMVGLNPSGELLVVSRSMSAANPPRLVGFARTIDMVLEELDVVFPRPHAVALGHDGRFAYTASLGTNQLASVDLVSQAVELVEVSGPPHAFVQLAISPDGKTLVASGELSGELVVFDLDDPARPEFMNSLALGPRPFDPVFSPDGQTVWVPIKGADEVAIVETADWTVLDRIRGDGLRQPHAIEFSPDGGRAFVTNNAVEPGELMPGSGQASTIGARLVVIDTEMREIESTLMLGQNLTGMGRRQVR